MIVSVRFHGTVKLYNYNTDLSLLKDGKYEIETNGGRTYDNAVTVVEIKNGHDKNLRTISKARLIKGPKRPKNPYKAIYVNEEKETICVVWHDGTKTIMKPQDGDDFDIEKGIALCFMKKAFDNRGCYYNAFRDIITN